MGGREKYYSLRYLWKSTFSNKILEINISGEKIMRILIVDNNFDVSFYPQGAVVRMALAPKNIFNVRTVTPDILNETHMDFDRVILTGSTSYIRQETEWMKKERDYIEKWIKRGIPLLGICFGGQLISRHLFGISSIQALPVPISGSIMMEYKEGCSIFGGLPNPFGVVTAHYEGFSVEEKYRIAAIPEWESYAFNYQDIAYGLQFHPELMGHIGRTLVKMQKFFFDRHVFQEFSIKTHARHGTLILQNFLKEPEADKQ